MRNVLRLLLPIVAVAAATSGAVGCSSLVDDSSTSESAQTEEELAIAALRVLGAKVQGEERNEATCHQCHDPNRLTIRKWVDDYKKTMETVADESKSVEERINFMRRDPGDPGSSFAPAKLGIMTAGSHLGVGANVSPERHPLTHKQGSMLAKLFEGREDDYRQFRQDTLMPIEASYDRLTSSEFETVMRWVDKGLPNLDALLPEAPRPTTCTDDFGGLAEHVRAIRSTSWASANRDARMPMFGCAANADPLECFGQKTAEGKAIFPASSELDYGKKWSPSGDTLRVLRELDYKTFFWTRTSADGRFVANGGGPRTDGARAVISDLAASLDPEGPKVRDILASASYDPDFFPGNQGFLFQGTSKAGAFCSMSLLTNPATTKVSFDEPECTKLDSVGLYQTVGQVSGDNSISDIFVVNSKFASDNPGLTASDRDLRLTAGPDAAVKVHVGVALGNDADEGYKIMQHAELKTPFRGDTMMSRTGLLLGSRVAGETGALGYHVDKLTYARGEEGYKFSLRTLGRICMPGNKANFSFDERFLTTHHYLTREDFESDEAFEPYKAQGAADIWVADFITGKKERVTRMAPGQFAIFPHFRSDGWLYFMVRDANTQKEYIVVSDYALRAERANP